MPDATAESSPARNHRKGGLPIFTGLAVALVGAGVLVGGVAGGVAGALIHPGSGSTSDTAPAETAEASAPTFTDQEIGAAKANVCAAYGKVHQAVLINTGRNGEEDQAMIFAIAANARMALFDGGSYLLVKVDQAPAAPAGLATAVRSLAGAYQQLSIDYLAEVPEEEQQASLQAVDATNAPVFEMCQ